MPEVRLHLDDRAVCGLELRICLEVVDTLEVTPELLSVSKNVERSDGVGLGVNIRECGRLSRNFSAQCSASSTCFLVISVDVTFLSFGVRAETGRFGGGLGLRL